MEAAKHLKRAALVIGVLGAAMAGFWGAYHQPEAGPPAQAAGPAEKSTAVPRFTETAGHDHLAPGQEAAPAAAEPSAAARDRRRSQETDPELKRAHLQRTGRLLAAALPWLEQRRLDAEKAGDVKLATTLSVRQKRLAERLKVVQEGVDPDAPAAPPSQRGSSAQ